MGHVFGGIMGSLATQSLEMSRRLEGVVQRLQLRVGGEPGLGPWAFLSCPSQVEYCLCLTVTLGMTEDELQRCRQERLCRF